MGTYSTKSRNLDKKTSIRISYPNGTEIVTPVTKVSDQTTYGFSTRSEPSDADLVSSFGTTSLPRRLDNQNEAEVNIDPGTGRPAKTTFDNGHPFTTTKRWESYSHPNWGMTGRDGIKFQGPLLINGAFDGGINFPTVDDMSQNDVNYFGSLAIANTTPTAPAADLATFVGETATGGLPIKLDDLTSLGSKRNADGTHSTVRVLNDTWKGFEKIANDVLNDNPAAALKGIMQQVGKGYIASSFGFLPFVNDITKLCQAVIHQNDLIRQYLRDGSPDKIVRRRYGFPQTHEIGEPTQVGTAPFWKTDLTSGGQYVWVKDGNSSGPVLRQDQVFTDIWFSGAYSYFVYDSVKGSLLDKMEIWERNANYVLGSRLTLEALWEMAPWSWLADYKFNVGNVISNITNFEKDNLVLRYGYLMRKTHKIRTYSTTGPDFVSGNPGTVYRRFDVQRKERYKATPYGFGVNPADFNPRQWSILAALGMTKGDGRFLRNE